MRRSATEGPSGMTLLELGEDPSADEGSLATA